MRPWNPNTKSTGRPGELNPGSSNRPPRPVCTVLSQLSHRGRYVLGVSNAPILRVGPQCPQNFGTSYMHTCSMIKATKFCMVINWMLVCWWWWFDWSFAQPIAPVVTTTSIILCFTKHRLTRFTWKMAVKMKRERKRDKQDVRIILQGWPHRCPYKKNLIQMMTHSAFCS